MLGTVAWAADGGTIYAYNTSPDTPVLLTYSASDLQGASPAMTTAMQQLEPNNGWYVANQNITDYLGGGTVVVSPLAAGTEDTIGQAVSFAIRTLAVGATVSIIGGITGKFTPPSAPGQGYTFTLATTGPRITSGSLNLTDANGISTNVDLKFGSGVADDDSASVVLPPDLDLEPVIPSLTLNLQVDAAGLDQMLDASGRRSQPGTRLPAAVRAMLG